MLKRMLLIMLMLSSLAFAQQPMNHNSVVEINENDTLYKEGKILIKIFDELAHIDLTQEEGVGNNGQGIPAISQLNEDFQVTSVKKLFGFVKKINKNPHDLTTIYEIEYDAPIDPQEAAIRYTEIPEIEFAEPDYIASILINPNDPYYADGSQWYHDDVHAEEAWELSTGDATQIIGIIDTGVDWEHDDLEENIWTNQAELDGEEGVDDDDNGFVDDYRGWDFVNDDNNPADDNSHGTHVAGIAGAKTNNNLGIAGIAWNAKLMAIKVMQSSGRGSWSDIAQGAAYAADNGATVANMSLGGYTESLTLKTALENAYHYSVIVAAAGNDGLCIGAGECLGLPMYPAVYSWVLGVQASTSFGGRASFSNYDPSGPKTVGNDYGYNYEVLAPGSVIYSTIPGNGYRYLSGTSMATPVTSGAVALIKSYLPNSTTEQVFARIIQGSGSGVLDIEEAMTLDLVPDVRLESFKVIDTLDGCDSDGRPDAGETVLIRIDVKNYGGLAENVQAEIRLGEFEDSIVVNIIDTLSELQNISAYAHVNSDDNPFKVSIPSNIANNRDIVLNVKLTADNWSSSYEEDIILTVENGIEFSGIYEGKIHLHADKYYIISNQFVCDTLILDPGTTLRLSNDIYVNKYLISYGKPDSLITFMSNNSNYWNWIDSKIYSDTWGIHHYSYNYFYRGYANPNYHSIMCKVENSVFDEFDNIDDYRNETENVKIDFSIIKNGMFPGNNMDINLSNSVIINNLVSSTTSLIPFREGNLMRKYNNSIFGNYASEITYPIPQVLIYGSWKYYILAPNYFGTGNNLNFEPLIFDFYDDGDLPPANTDLLQLNAPLIIHGHVWQVLTNGVNAYDEDFDPVGSETVKFDVYFNRAMDTTFTPFLTFGVREPYTQRAVVDSARWINWKKDSLGGDTYYHLQVAKDRDFSNVVINEEDILGLNYLSDLTGNERYFWRVRYKNGTLGDYFEWSDIKTFESRKTKPPVAPEIIIPSYLDTVNSSFYIKIAQNMFVERFDYQIATDSEFNNIEKSDTSISGNKVYVDSLENSTTYFIRVRGKNVFGEGNWSDGLEFTTIDTNIYVAPQLIYPENNAETFQMTKETFLWENVNWAKEYRFQVSNSTSFSTLYFDEYISDTLLNFATELWTSGYRYWRIKAIGNGVESDWSEPYKLTVLTTEVNISLDYDFTYDLLSFRADSLLSDEIDVLPNGSYYWRIGTSEEIDSFTVVKQKCQTNIPIDNSKWIDTNFVFRWNNAPQANTVYNARWQAYHTMDFTTGDGLQMIRVAGARDNEGFEIPVEWNRFEFEVQATAALSNDFIALGDVGKIDLEWGMPDAERDILGFNLYRCVKQDSVTWVDTTKVNSILITDSTYSDYDIIPDSTYYYVYRIVRTTLDEGEDSRMVSASAYPTVLDPPNLEYPPNDTTKLPINLTFDWDEPSGATSYFIKIATDIAFSNIIVDTEVNNSEYTSSGLSNRTRYYWRVKAEGVQGASAWSDTRTFLTIPVIPDVPVLTYPDNNEVAMPLSITFDWENANEADTYYFQLSEDQYFANLIYDTPNINYSYKSVSGLAIDQTYYWRVRSKNDAGYSNWSNTWLFTTDTSGAADPPASWDFTDMTGSNSNIVVPKNINPQINGRAILPGDAIGVFYLDSNEYYCAGYAVWDGNNSVLTVWGDDSQTSEKDGFDGNEDYNIRLWDSRLEEEFLAQATYTTGNDYFTDNGFSVLGSLISKELTTHNISLHSGWNMISSYLEPEDSDLDVIFSGLSDTIIIVRDGNNKIFIPEQYNTIIDWNYMDGYLIYSTDSTIINLSGYELIPEDVEIPLATGWNISAYLRNNNMNIEIALQDIETDLLIVKDERGRVYLPSYDFNSIGNMQIGKGYQIYMLETANLTYPSNDELGKVVSFDNIKYYAPKYYKNDIELTDNNMTLILRANIEDMNETAVLNENDKIVGTAVFNDGIAVVTIWGNDENDYNSLKIKTYNEKTNVEKIVELDNFIELTKNSKSGLSYKKDAVLIGDYFDDSSDLPAIFIKPNPFSTEAEIEYFIPQSGNVEIALYNEAGSKIMTIVDAHTQKGINKTILTPENLSSGSYNIIMKYNGKTYFEKAIYVK